MGRPLGSKNKHPGKPRRKRVNSLVNVPLKELVKRLKDDALIPVGKDFADILLKIGVVDGQLFIPIASAPEPEPEEDDPIPSLWHMFDKPEDT